MCPEKPTMHHHCTPAVSAQLEGCIVSFFSSVADIELLSGQPIIPAQATSRGIIVIINFGGLEHGFFAISCTDAVARKLAASMAGEADELPDSYLGDALGEAANILTCSLLDIISDQKHCMISVPAIIRNDTALLQKLIADTRGYTGSFLHGTERVLIKVVVHPPNCQAITNNHLGGSTVSLHQAHQLFSCPRFGQTCRQMPFETALDRGIRCIHSTMTSHRTSPC